MNHVWKTGRVKDLIGSLDAGVSVNGEDRVPSDDEPAVLKISAVTYGVFDPTASKPISGRELKRAKCNPRVGQIIISRSNTPALVGACAFIDRDYPNRYLSDKLWQTSPNNSSEFEMKWLAYFLASPWARYRLSNLATGTSDSMKNITKDELLTLPLSIPPITEQRAIAALFSTWDLAIEKTERLVEAKEKHFLYFSKKLLFGDVTDSANTSKKTKWFSVPDHWKVVNIVKIAKEVSVFNNPAENIPVLSCTKYDGLVDSLTYFNKQVFSLDTSTYKVVTKGQFAYATNHVEEGSIGYQDVYDKGLVSPMYTVFETNENVDDSYLYKVLKSVVYLHIFRANTSSSVDRRGSLRWKEFSKLPIPLPPIEEQKQIAAILTTARQEIDLLKKQAEAYRRQKRGLMQKLLTGEWRVKLGGDEHGLGTD
jgi:type I restriction enzyme S subunit